jgi:hypothetical protein
MAAKAAKDSVDAYRSSERPFLMIEMRGEGRVEFWAVNHGRSPARIIFCNTVPFINAPPVEEFPDKLCYGSGWDSDSLIQLNVPWIEPKGEWQIGSFGPTDLKILPSEVIDDISHGRRILFIHSGIKYRGIGDRQSFVSTYCYRRFRDGRMEMYGAYGWNDCT